MKTKYSIVKNNHSTQDVHLSLLGENPVAVCHPFLLRIYVAFVTVSNWKPFLKCRRLTFQVENVFFLKHK